MTALLAPLALCAETYLWSGGAKGKWESAKNWEPHGVPGRLDTVKLANEAIIDLGRDRMISNAIKRPAKTTVRVENFVFIVYPLSKKAIL